MFDWPKEYEVIVVGSGHAGIEAALASARLGCQTLMLTQNLDTIGQMSCNPAIGGLAKGHIVREIDALGGAMGLNADATGIQFRMLNRTKGPSVRAPRVQCDKKAYQFRAKALLERAENLDVQQATVSEILVRDGLVAGVTTDMGARILAKAVVIIFSWSSRLTLKFSFAAAAFTPLLARSTPSLMAFTTCPAGM